MNKLFGNVILNFKVGAFETDPTFFFRRQPLEPATA